MAYATHPLYSTATANKSSAHSSQAPLQLDAGDALEEHDEPLLPMVSSSAGITEEKARILLQKYGLSYQQHKSTSPERPHKIQRVMRPIRIRIHWICHHCKTTFAPYKACVSCGHQRCNACTRQLPKRVKELLDSTGRSKEGEAKVEDQPLVSDVVAAARGQSQPSQTPMAPLETDDQTGEDDITPVVFKYAIQLRPSGGIQHVHRPTAQIVRRVCHECQTEILPPSRTTCQNCGHARCSRCLRLPSKRGKPALSPASEEKRNSEAQVAPTVQRVYRKPRQRVRYTCDQCQTVLLDYERCQSCGHEKCEHCLRCPPKKEKSPPDPAVMRAVEQKLAAFPLDQSAQQVVVAG